MKHDCDVLIVGGGLNGPALALALASVGMTSTVLDAMPADAAARGDFDGRAYAICAVVAANAGGAGALARAGGERAADRRHPDQRRAARQGGGAAVPAFRQRRDRRGADGPYPRGSLPAARPARCDGGGAAGDVAARNEGGGAGGGAGRDPGRTGGRHRALGAGARGLRRAGQRGRHPRRDRADGLGLRAELAGLRHRPRKVALWCRAPVLHAGGAAGDPALVREPLVDRLDREPVAGRGDLRAGRRRLSRASCARASGIFWAISRWRARGSAIRSGSR